MIGNDFVIKILKWSISPHKVDQQKLEEISFVYFNFEKMKFPLRYPPFFLSLHLKVCILKPLQRNGWLIFNEKQFYLFTKV